MKIPGLYIIDSIVRQGQKQFKEKDVFGPRFAINIVRTIEGILDSCPADERVSCLWILFFTFRFTFFIFTDYLIVF